MNIHLNTKSHYTLLKSTLKIDSLINYALKNKHSYVCLCEVNFLGSSLEFIKKAQQNNLKPVVSLEVQTTIFNEQLTFLLTALNNEGIQSLKKISTAALTGGLSDEILLNNLTGLNVSLDLISTPLHNDYLFNNQINTTFIDNLPLNLTYYLSILDNEFKQALLKHNIPLIAAMPIYCHSKDDSASLHILECIKDKKIVDNVVLNNIYHLGLNDDFNYDEIELDNLNKLLNSIENYQLETYDSLPQYKEDSNDYLSKLALAGLSKRLNNKIPDNYLNRLKYELNTIVEMGYSNYFLIVYDYVLFAKKNDILVGPGRGSSAGSLVAYCLGITDIDPIKEDLLFERFLNPERINLPDIDVDFEDSKRGKVIEYLKDKYGVDHVAHITTYDTFKAKNTINDVARVFNIPSYQLKEITRHIDRDDNLVSLLEQSHELRNTLHNNQNLANVYKHAMKLQGLNRNYSTHAAGLLITKEELVKYTPIMKHNDYSTYSTQYTMEYLEEIGLYKMDILGLKTLNILSSILNQIPNLQLNQIPVNDLQTLSLMNQGKTLGIFQFESTGVISALKKMNIKHIDDLVATTALYRPGPMKFLQEFINRQTGVKQPKYLHKDLVNILEPTYGIIVYQEQIMQISQKLAGFSLAKADIIRKGMAKKNITILNDIKKDFINSSVNNGYSLEVASAVYDMIFEFSNYGFNKSHAAAYGLLSYYMAYLKVHYPREFYKSMLSANIYDVKALKKYAYDMQPFGLKILGPNLNKSSEEVIIEDNDYILPFTIIKGIGKVQAQIIINEQQTALFDEYEDSVLRLLNKGLNLKTIEKLIYAGCFDIFNYNRTTMIENLIELEKYFHIVYAKGQQISFSESYLNKPIIIKHAQHKNILEKEFEVLGLYISEHPLSVYESQYPNSSINEFKINNPLLVQIDNIKEIRTKKGELMAFFGVSDQISKTTLILFPDTYQQYQQRYKVKDIILVKGQLSNRNDDIVAKSIKLINERGE